MSVLLTLQLDSYSYTIPYRLSDTSTGYESKHPTGAVDVVVTMYDSLCRLAPQKYKAFSTELLEDILYQVSRTARVVESRQQSTNLGHHT